MPDHAAFAPAVRLALVDAADQGLDTERLLMARGNLADFPVEQDEEPDELKQPFLAEKANQHAVLIGRQLLSGPQAFEVAAQMRRAVRKNRLPDLIADGSVLDRVEIRFVEFFFPPARPELLRRFGRGVAAIRAADGEEELRIGEELRDLVVLLVADVLADPFIEHGFVGIAGIGSFGLDDDKRQPIDETHEIRPPRVRTARGHDLEFLGHDKTVRRWIVPVDNRNGWVSASCRPRTR